MKYMRKFVAALLALTLLMLAAVSCGQAYRNDLTAEQVMNTVLAAIPSEEGYRQVSDGYISSSTWGESYQALLDKAPDRYIVISEKSDMNINEVGVIHVTNASDVSEVKAVVEAFVEGQKLRYQSLLESYNPDELPKLEEAEVEVCGNYIFYSILTASDTDKALTAFEDAVKAE